MTSSTPRCGRQFSVRWKEPVGRLLLGVAVQHEVRHRSERGRRADILDPVRECQLEAGLHRGRARAIGTLGAVTVTAPFSLRSSSEVPTSMRGQYKVRFVLSRGQASAVVVEGSL
jgi:hypothetical protein